MRRIHFLLTFLLLAQILHGQREEYTWDYITFEEPYQFLSIDSTEHNIWEIGEANTNWLYAYAGSNAIFTGNQASYPPNNHSTFTLVLSIANIDHYPYSVYLEFQHRMDTEVGKDGGYIEVSYDIGESWTNIIEDKSSCINPGEWPNHVLYTSADTLFNGIAGFSGTHDWERVLFGWEYCLVKEGKYEGDSLLLRFNFISDGNETNQKGWIIDHIRLFSVRLMGAVEEERGKDIRVFPNPAGEYVTVETSMPGEITGLELLDLQGRRLRSQQEGFRINVSDVRSGMYVVRIKYTDASFIRKIMVE